MKNDLIEYFIGEKATIIVSEEDEETYELEGIIIDFNLEEYEVTLFENDGRIITYGLENGTQELFIDDHKNIRKKILSTPKPKKYNKFENIDI